MKEVDFAKLSEQYASFLVAFGGVSITVLALVLSLGTPSSKLTQGDLGSFLILALIVATVCCFIGAHMMAETAAFIGRVKEKSMIADPKKEILPAGTSLGERLFLLATINIFIAVSLVLFALMLLPSASTLPDAASIKWISFVVFLLVIAGAFIWMILAANHRIDVAGSGYAILKALGLGLVWGCILCLGFFLIHKQLLLWLTFIPITLITVGLLLYFAWSFKDSDKVSSRTVNTGDIFVFALSVIISYVSIVIASIRTMFW
jgi:cytochrome b